MIFTHILPMMGELSSFSRTIFRYRVIDIAPASNGQNGSKFLIDFLKCLRNRYYGCTCTVLPRQSNNLFLQYLQSLNSNFFFQISYRKLQHNLILGLWPAPGCTLIISKISSVYFNFKLNILRSLKIFLWVVLYLCLHMTLLVHAAHLKSPPPKKNYKQQQ